MLPGGHNVTGHREHTHVHEHLRGFHHRARLRGQRSVTRDPDGGRVDALDRQHHLRYLERVRFLFTHLCGYVLCLQLRSPSIPSNFLLLSNGKRMDGIHKLYCAIGRRNCSIRIVNYFCIYKSMIST